jgi:hypothetical protein
MGVQFPVFMLADLSILSPDLKTALALWLGWFVSLPSDERNTLLSKKFGDHNSNIMVYALGQFRLLYQDWTGLV